MNTIQFEKITRIRIQTLVFGLNYSNSIQIPKFKYQIIRSPLVQTIQKLSTQSRNCPDNPETVRTIQKLAGQSNCPYNPETEFLQLAYNTKFKHFLRKKFEGIRFYAHLSQICRCRNLHAFSRKFCMTNPAVQSFFLLTLIS